MPPHVSFLKEAFFNGAQTHEGLAIARAPFLIDDDWVLVSMPGDCANIPSSLITRLVSVFVTSAKAISFIFFVL